MVQKSWFDEHSCIRLHRYEGRWDAGDIYTSLGELPELTRDKGRPVDLIVDFTDSTPVIGSNLFPLMARTERITSQGARHVVVVGANRYLKTMANFGKQMFPNTLGKFAFVDSIDEAAEWFAQAPVA